MSVLQILHAYGLSDDLCDYIIELSTRDTCQRCGVDTITEKRISVCIVGNDRLCFTCCHKALNRSLT